MKCLHCGDEKNYINEDCPCCVACGKKLPTCVTSPGLFLDPPGEPPWAHQMAKKAVKEFRRVNAVT
jgi:hypothetical protein